MSYSFTPGNYYMATPTMREAGQRLLMCVARYDDTVTLSDVRRPRRAVVKLFEGRETATLKSVNGLDYFLSAAAVVDSAVVDAVLAAHERDEVRA